MVDLALDCYQRIEVDPLGSGSTITGVDSAWPRTGKFDLSNVSDEVDAVWRGADLQDFLRIVRVEKPGTAEV